MAIKDKFNTFVSDASKNAKDLLEKSKDIASQAAEKLDDAKQMISESAGNDVEMASCVGCGKQVKNSAAWRIIKGDDRCLCDDCYYKISLPYTMMNRTDCDNFDGYAEQMADIAFEKFKPEGAKYIHDYLGDESTQNLIEYFQEAPKILMTTGYNFEGYRITDYCGVIFDEAIFGLGLIKGLGAAIENTVSSISGSEANTMTGKLNEIKDQLRERVVRKAIKSGGNALIGIDFESSTVGQMMMVSMTATAVKIEKIEE